MGQLIRVNVTGPQHRVSILAHSYQLAYIRETNRCSLTVNGTVKDFTLEVDYVEAGDHRVEVLNEEGHNVGSFTLSSVHEPDV